MAGLLVRPTTDNFDARPDRIVMEMPSPATVKARAVRSSPHTRPREFTTARKHQNSYRVAMLRCEAAKTSVMSSRSMRTVGPDSVIANVRKTSR